MKNSAYTSFRHAHTIHLKNIFVYFVVVAESSWQKKTKVFISPNRFTVHTTDASNDQPTATSSFCSTNVPSASQPTIPPIFVKNIANFSAFKTALINITIPDSFTCRAWSLYLEIQPLSRQSIIVSWTIYTNPVLVSTHKLPVTFTPT